MYEGQQRTYYGGVERGDGTFLLSAFITDLTSPDELPYLTNQMKFDAVEGWQSQLWYPDDFITDYALLSDPIALSREGILFNADTGNELSEVDPLATTHFNTMTAFDALLTIAGDNGRYWSGTTGDLNYLDNPIYQPLPAPDSSVEEKIQWGQQMQQAFTSLALGPRDILIGGARGFLARLVEGEFRIIPTGIDAHITGMTRATDGTVYICGHSPNSFVGIVNPDETVRIMTMVPSGPRLHSPSFFQDTLYVGASDTEVGGIFTLTSEGLIKNDVDDRTEFGSLRHLQLDNVRLWAVFEKALVVLESQTQRVHRHPTNV